MGPVEVLVTGASGFVGSALVRRYLGEGVAVRAAVRDRRSYAGGATEICEVGELSACTSWSAALQGIRVVIHCAARAHVMRDTAQDPDSEFKRVNTQATLSLGRQAAASGVRRLVFVSSIHVNGVETFSRPFAPEDPPAPRSSYAESKYQAEIGLEALAQPAGMDWVIVRPPLVYGPGARGNVVRMMRWLRTGVPLPLASIDNRRSMIGLENLVDVLATCAAHPAAANRTFLISDGEDVSTPDLLRRMGRALGAPARLFALSPRRLRTVATWLGRAEEAQRLCGSLQVDSTEARRLLGWKAPQSMDDGIRRMAEHFLREAAV